MSSPVAAPLGDASLGKKPSTLPSVHTARRPDALFHVVILLLCAGVLVAAGCLRADASTVTIPYLNRPLPELCMLRRYTGMACPGCGLTRCFISLAHGDWRSAWAFNPAGVWLFAIVAVQVPWQAYQLWRINRGQRELALTALGQIGLAVFILMLLGQWLARLVGIPF